MKHFVAIEDFKVGELESLVKAADSFKNGTAKASLAGKTLVTMFFNPSTRTKTSFDLAMQQLGGHTVTLEPGKSSWGIEINEGAVMNGEEEEHLKDATKVLNRYADGLAVRCFPKFQDWNVDKKDLVVRQMAKWSSKPVVNMETITHPCQALAMMQLIKAKLGKPQKKKFLLTWSYHPKPLNTAVGNSAGVAAAMFGMDVTLAIPQGYELDPYYMGLMKDHCKTNGAQFEVTNDQEAAYEGANFVYTKSWGSLKKYGKLFDKAEHDTHKDWIVTQARMDKTDKGYFSHCLPVRRNLEVTDEVIDGPRSLVYDEAENRLHIQKAILTKLLAGN
jgi:N-acetylornithine carbamoyltransferase